MESESQEASPLIFFHVLIWAVILAYFVFAEWPPSAGFLFGAGGTFIGHVLWLAEMNTNRN